MARILFSSMNGDLYFCYGRIIRGGISGCRLSCEICEFKELIPIESLFVFNGEEFNAEKINFYVRNRLEAVLKEYENKHGKKIDIENIPVFKDTELMTFEPCEFSKKFEIDKKELIQNGNGLNFSGVLNGRFGIERNFK